MLTAGRNKSWELVSTRERVMGGSKRIFQRYHKGFSEEKNGRERMRFNEGGNHVMFIIRLK